MSIFKNGKEIVRAWLSDGVTDGVIDAIANGLNVILTEHHEIHEGESYYHSSFVDLAGTASRQFILVTPDTAARMHFVYEVSFENESTVTITEGVSTDADGTAITELNRDRNSANTTTAVLTHTPTNPTGGTSIEDGSAGSGQKVGGLKRDEDEKILKQNTKYLINITNNSATASKTSWVFNWYQEG